MRPFSLTREGALRIRRRPPQVIQYSPRPRMPTRNQFLRFAEYHRLVAQIGQGQTSHLGWRTLRRLGLRRHTPRPRHVQATDRAAQETFKGGCES